ncbi:MAG: NAD(P)-dependent oxidoreductase [Chloroflexota bacterium]|nr:NAD(P)-dependent oxidoreductase [Chloroflexota bacterium]MDP6508843.1 NAD(P)-dependent oxidoreductase [Chloroflexota bacterium]MDP6758737.1 NAD(P)-dependent oxidoreductase [Chloroflexota bacterium]
MRLGFIGLGLMGLPMARNLLKAGHELTVHNRSQAGVEELVAAGATRAATVGEVVAADFIMTALPVPETVEEIYLGDGGLIANAPPGSILIDFSTNGIDTALRCGAAAAEKGIGYLDAPMSGGPARAEDGSLSIMLGGSEEDFAKARPVLDIVGGSIFLCGPVGAGTAVKMANQLIVGVTNAAVAEAFVLATKSGVDPALVYEVLNGAVAQSAVMTWTIPDSTLKRDFDPRFSLDLLTKDLGLITDMGKAQGVRLAVTTMAEVVHREAQAQGEGSNNVSAIIRPLEKLAGVEVRPRD